MSLLGQTARYLLLSALAITLLGSVGFYTLIHRKIQHEVDEILSSQIEHSRLRLNQVGKNARPRADWSDNLRIERVDRPGRTRFSDETQLDSLNNYERIDIRQLADILLTNLLKNSVRHGEPGGCVQLSLTADFLQISNNGSPLPFNHAQLFTRFVRNPAQSDSTDLGLALVKQITDRYHLPLTYEYDPTNRMHRFRLGLRPAFTA